MAGIQILGVHHVTAVCGDPQRNVNFYTGPLGLRLVKISVHPEDPTSYHLFYGDSQGTPGSLISFHSKPRGPQGAKGVGMFTSLAFAIPTETMSFWRDRLSKYSLEHHKNCHGEPCLSIDDPDGLRIHFVERPRFNRNAWTARGLTAEAAISGIDTVTLGTRSPASKQFLPQKLGLTTRLESAMQSGNVLARFEAGDNFIDVMPTEHRSLAGRGTIHHASLRVSDEADLLNWSKELSERGTPVSEVRDHTYYKAIYLREPGGALLALATDKPGYTVDEDRNELGTHLCIPPHLAAKSADFERLLPPLKLPIGIS